MAQNASNPADRDAVPTASPQQTTAAQNEPTVAREAGQLPGAAPTTAEEAIRERLESHPNAMVRDIIASMELDGIDVTPEQVEAVMNQMRSPPA